MKSTNQKYIGSLDGLRAVAALGVMTTHVAFHTDSVSGDFWFRIWGRFDLWVAVFFALSGFLLWRNHASIARQPDGASHRTNVWAYVRSRIIRIMPAYVVMAVCALLFLADNRGASLMTWCANLTLSQVFVAGSLTAGITHAWSLSVEMVFYLTLPIMWMAMRRLRGSLSRWRIPVLVTWSVLSLGWAFLPLPLADGLNSHTLPPAFTSWFAAGMICAELWAKPPRWAHACASQWLLCWSLACGVLVVSSLPVVGPEGFVHPSDEQFAIRTLCGAIIAFLFLAPLVLRDPQNRFVLLDNPVMNALGCWSYSIFLWHLIVLSVVFDMVFVQPFAGNMFIIWVATVLLTLPISAASYVFIEQPPRRWLKQWEQKQQRSQAPQPTSAAR